MKHPNVPNFAPNGVRLPELSLVKSRAYRPLIGELQAHPLRGDGSLTILINPPYVMYRMPQLVERLGNNIMLVQ